MLEDNKLMEHCGSSSPVNGISKAEECLVMILLDFMIFILPHYCQPIAIPMTAEQPCCQNEMTLLSILQITFHRIPQTDFTNELTKKFTQGRIKYNGGLRQTTQKRPTPGRDGPTQFTNKIMWICSIYKTFHKYILTTL